MKVGFKITANVNPLQVAASSHGEWPLEDRRALYTAVRHKIKKRVQTLLSGDKELCELGIEVEVQ